MARPSPCVQAARHKFPRGNSAVRQRQPPFESGATCTQRCLTLRSGPALGPGRRGSTSDDRPMATRRSHVATRALIGTSACTPDASRRHQGGRAQQDGDGRQLMAGGIQARLATQGLRAQVFHASIIRSESMLRCTRKTPRRKASTHRSDPKAAMERAPRQQAGVRAVSFRRLGCLQRLGGSPGTSDPRGGCRRYAIDAPARPRAGGRRQPVSAGRVDHCDP